MKQAVLYLLAGFGSCKVQGAGYFHGADELDELRLAYDSDDPATRADYFRGCVAGIPDITHGTGWYLPDKATGELINASVSKYLREHPAPVKQDAAGLITAALSNSFPRRNK